MTNCYNDTSVLLLMYLHATSTVGVVDNPMSKTLKPQEIKVPE